MASHPHTQNQPGERKNLRGRPVVDGARTRARETATEQRERLMDEELDDTFPASDPPSWTMGGSVVSTLRH